MTIQAIETRYAGCRFRSRLEARWAVFYGQMGIRWEYEPQGYVIDGTPYLPDFWLPEHETWIEIKGATLTVDYADYTQLLARFAEQTEKRVVMFAGPIPAPDRYGHTGTGEVFDSWGWDDQQRWWICWRCSKPYIAFDGSNGHQRCPRCRRQHDRHDEAESGEMVCRYTDAETYVSHCLEAARSARFEHGEQG